MMKKNNTDFLVPKREFGNMLSVKAWWTDLRRSKSKPELGFAGIKCKVTNQNIEPVIEYGYRYIIACKDSV